MALSSGDRFGRLTALTRAAYLEGSRSMRWRFRCDCGTEKVIRVAHVTRGLIVSCGCHRTEMVRTHGKTHTPEHAVWGAMVQRCRNPNNANYANYGKRGIVVCERWSDFANFLSDMGERPFPGATLDRIDNDGGYSPGNCRWTTMKVQGRNNRRNKTVPYKGRQITIAEAAEIAGTDPSTMWRRVEAQWPEDRMFSAPALSGRRLKIKTCSGG